MRRSAELIGIDPKQYRVESITDKGAYMSAYAHRLGEYDPCPKCKSTSIVAHAHKQTTIYHAPLKNKPLLIVLDKRRLRCKKCGCTFWQSQPLLSQYSIHLSVECERYVLNRLEQGATMALIEHECGASRNILCKVEQSVDIRCKRLPVHICIDEVKAFPRRISIPKGEPHMVACIYDAHERTLKDMICGAEGPDVKAYLSRFDKLQLASVESVSCDLKDAFIKLANELFPNALVYADKFHVSKLICAGVDDERKAIERMYRVKRDALNSKTKAWEIAHVPVRMLHRASKLLLTRKSNLNDKQQDIVAQALELDGTQKVRIAYLALQLFYEWADAEYESREKMERALRTWISRCRDSRMPHSVTRPAKTIKNQMEYILNGWQTGRTNAVAESLNRSIKDIIRECRGFNSFDALRQRCLIRLGHVHTPNAPIPLFKRTKKKEAE